MTQTAPTYRFRFFFDAGTGACLWAANDAARARFDYPTECRDLPISENLQRYLYYLAAWYDTSIDWNYPPDPSPWTQDEASSFNDAVKQLLPRLRNELGHQFEIVDEFQPVLVG